MAVMRDYDIPAEENWGLLDFLATYFLFDPGETSDSLKQQVCQTVTHELSHQVSGEFLLIMRK